MPKAVPTEIEPCFRINLSSGFAFGPGKAALLENIASTGSISQAANAMGMSYMRAWKIVQSLDAGLREPLVVKTRGGKARGGAALTVTGLAVLELYRQLERDTAAAVAKARKRLNALR